MPPVNTTDVMKARDPIRDLQLNEHRPEKVMIILFNTSSTRLFHFLLIQELHINFFSHLPMTDPNWHMSPPLMTTSPSMTGGTRVKCVIYVNNQLPTHRFSPIKTDSPLIAGVTVALPSPHPPCTSYQPTYDQISAR